MLRHRKTESSESNLNNKAPMTVVWNALALTMFDLPASLLDRLEHPCVLEPHASFADGRKFDVMLVMEKGVLIASLKRLNVLCSQSDHDSS